MTKEEKAAFVANLSSAVVRDILTAIEREHVPETWDDIELRQYLADQFAREARSKMDRKRASAYRSDVATRFGL